MNVQKLLVLALESDSPILPSAQALANKHKNQGRGDPPLLHLTYEMLPLSYGEADWEKTLNDRCGKDLATVRGWTGPSVGISVHAHGQASGFGDYNVAGLQPDSLARLIASMGLKALWKVNIVACNVKVDFVETFCRELHRLTTLSPMVAGYNHFVTVLGSKATDNKTVYDIGNVSANAKPSDFPEIKPTDRAGYMGKKVVSADQCGSAQQPRTFFKQSHQIFLKPNGPVTSLSPEMVDIRERHKFVRQYTPFGVKAVSLNDWHSWTV